MEKYIVGGYVRDTLLTSLGCPSRPGDRDWVVVGETPESMKARGFLPVGSDFPVFLHPKTHEEHALARTERKTAPGYHGFVFHAAPDVTLEEDLRRRDLTVNAMALAADGRLVDPYGGLADLKAKILRHVSSAYTEDPVRVLRTARFAARFHDFSIAPETMALMRSMVDSGETDHLVAERVLAEMAKGLTTRTPWRFLEVLAECGYWTRSFRTVPLTAAVKTRLQICARKKSGLELRLLSLLADLGMKDGAGFLEKLRTPKKTRELWSAFVAVRPGLTRLDSPESVDAFFGSADFLRRRERARALLDFREVLLEAAEETPRISRKTLEALALAWSEIDAGAAARAAGRPQEIPLLVRAARRRALDDAWERLAGPAFRAEETKTALPPHSPS